ncbi:3-isopropylmalate dehydratase small subunit [Paraferrimonas sedimenticola]|uniref:3-isopropylmalate dehydratase small subunit n=1 Tax=Paraferrimonas sedimenticola TaxID=375674 RepID=A0AA37RX86_9GAMM|nr:3-isopropylmalate dehydratase small subunit [Paraferrimonas sedimenticola]GLP96367.1 3-isopropylmalate dehydratase small subunit [Paraferrimonas sedimenticola]
MQALTQLTAKVAIMDRDNVDTDAIMPKQYLQSVKKNGYGDWAFDDWRYLDPGEVSTDTATRRVNPDFELNQAQAQGAEVLITRDNFGCGSSREHAVWGIRDMGFRVIIASSFGDIFLNNCFNNGVLAISLPKDEIQALFENCEQGSTLSVDLENQTISASGKEYPFEVEAMRRYRLLNGLDSIGMTLGKSEQIREFESKHKAKHHYFFTPLAR